jgi:prophage regulatory protein
MKLNFCLLRLDQTLEMRRKSRSAHYRDVNAGMFPAPVRVGRRAVAWPAHEVQAILAAQVAGKGDAEIRDLVARLVSARSEFKLEVSRER